MTESFHVIIEVDFLIPSQDKSKQDMRYMIRTDMESILSKHVTLPSGATIKNLVVREKE